MRQDLANDEISTFPGTIQEGSPEFFHQTDGLGGGTDTYHHMEPVAEASSEQPNPTNANPRSTNNDLRHNPKPNCNDDYRQ